MELYINNESAGVARAKNGKYYICIFLETTRKNANDGRVLLYILKYINTIHVFAIIAA